MLITLLVMTIILVVVFGAANIILTGVKMEGTQENSIIAYFAAEAGAERLLWEIRKNSFENNCNTGEGKKYVNFSISKCDNGPEIMYPLPNGAEYNIIYTSNSPIAFQIFGGYDGVKRVVEISY